MRSSSLMEERAIMGSSSAIVSFRTPLLCRYKLLCFSLFYLLTTLLLALRFTLSSSKCVFRFSSSAADSSGAPLFSYPVSYGAHKYAIPTHRSSCSSPVFFSDYRRVNKEMQDLYRNSSTSNPVLRYMQGNAGSFGGNFSTQNRISYFDHLNDRVEIPCGFFKKFPVSDFDRIAMENCGGVVVVSAIFNNHDKIRQPKDLGPKTLDMVCFFMFVDDITLRGFDQYRLVSRASGVHKVGVWRIVKVLTENLYENPAMNGVIPKFLVHRLFPNSKYSIWIDAKLQLVVDPLLLIHSLVVAENVDMAVSKHPFFIHTMEDAMATARWKKWWDVDGLKTQMETYCENGLQPWTHKKLPYPSDVSDSALILRKHGLGSNLFSCLVFNELEAFNPRDQLAFAFVRDKMKPNLKLNMFEVDVFEQVSLEYRHSLKKLGKPDFHVSVATSSQPRRTRRARQSHSLFHNGSSCQKYFRAMWEESYSQMF